MPRQLQICHDNANLKGKTLNATLNLHCRGILAFFLLNLHRRGIFAFFYNTIDRHIQ
jgi:hypothetical protein